MGDFISNASRMVFLVMRTTEKKDKFTYQGWDHVQVGKNLTKQGPNTCMMAYFSSEDTHNECKQPSGDARAKILTAIDL